MAQNIKWMVLWTVCAMVGCSTIREARDVQKTLAPQGEVAALHPARERIDLSGKSLPELVDFALTNRPSLVASRLAVEDARLALKALAADAPIISKTPWTVPHLSASGGYDEVSVGDTYRDWDFSTYGNPSVGLSLSVLLWDFGRNDAQTKAQADRVVAAELQLVDDGFTVFEEVSTAYFTLLEYAALLEVAQSNEYEYVVHLQQVEDRRSLGESVQLDVLKARSDLSSAREQTVIASNDFLTAEVDLMRVLGLDIERVDPQSFGALAENVMEERSVSFASTTYTSTWAYEFARTNSPAIQVMRANLRAASYDVDNAVADLMPKITASASLSWADPLWLWSWGVEATQSIFEGFRKTTAIDRKVVALKAAAAKLEMAEHTLSGDIATAIATRDNAKEALETAETALSQAKENLDTVRREFEVGEASRVDYTDAVSSYTTELGNVVNAVYVGQIAEAALFQLLGTYPVYEVEKK